MQKPGPALPLGELGNCLRPPSPKILEKNRVVEEFQMNYKNNLAHPFNQKKNKNFGKSGSKQTH